MVNFLFTIKNPQDIQDIIDVIYKATFPDGKSDLWFDSYITTLLIRDIRSISEIEKISFMPNILKILATRASNLLNDADAARDAKLSPVTFGRYRALLKQIFLIYLLPPWLGNIGKRLVKSPKLYFTDTKLLCNLLDLDLKNLKNSNPTLFGHMIENFVASELQKQLSIIADAKLYYFGSYEDCEVDFVIEKRMEI